MPSAYGITNCVGWYQAGQGIYGDAGTTPASPGGSVAQWNDASGAGNHLTQTNAANRPIFNSYAAVVASGGPTSISPFGAATNSYQPSYPSALLFDGANSFLNMPSTLNVSSTGCTVVVCARGSGVSPVSLGPGSTGGILTFGVLGGAPQKMGVYNGSFFYFPTSTYMSAMTPAVYGFRVSAALNETRLYLGTNQTTAFAGNVLPSALAGGAIGRAVNTSAPVYGNFSFSGEITEAAVFQSAVSDVEIANLLADMQSANHLRADANTNQVIFIGDSLTCGGPTLHPISKNYPAIVCQQSGNAFKALTTAVIGNTIANQQYIVSSQLTSLDLTPFGISVAVICLGSNDIIGGRTSAQILADLATMGTQLRALGMKVIIATITPRTLSTGQTAVLTAVNAGLRTGYSAFADALVDWAADTRLSDPTNTIYYTDACHTTDIGDGVKAQLVKPVLDSILTPASTAATPLSYARFTSRAGSMPGTSGSFCGRRNDAVRFSSCTAASRLPLAEQPLAEGQSQARHARHFSN